MNRYKSQGRFKSEALRIDATTQKALRDLSPCTLIGRAQTVIMKDGKIIKNAV